MSNVDNGAARPTTGSASAATQTHPRGRGFSILSRLARETQPATPVEVAASVAPQVVAAPVGVDVVARPSARHVPTHLAEPATDPEPEWTAPVIPLDRTEPAPRHRRDDVDFGAERRSS